MPNSLANAVGGVINGQLYVAGGQEAGLGQVSSLYVYDPPSNSWTQLASMPQTGSNGVGGVLNSELYVQSACEDTSNCNITAFDVYDPATNSWTALANSPNSTANGAAAFINGKLYTVTYVSANQSASEVYDPASNTWTAFATPPAAVSSPASVELDGKLYLFGGGYPNWRSIVQAYDPILNSWEKIKPEMPTALNWATAQVDYGIAFVVGGSTSNGLSGTNEDFIELPSIP